jgi:phosphate transport system ATP-binding protein
LLCDEVTSALDPISVNSVEETLEELKSEYTIILVTHSMAQARRLADEVIFLYLGEVVEANNVQSFFEDPQKERTKRFIGGPTPVESGSPVELNAATSPTADGGENMFTDATESSPPEEQ